MYTELATKLVVPINSVDQYSPAVAMGSENSVELDVVTIVYGGSALTCAIQGSNDAQNWSSDLATSTPTAVGFTNVSLTYTTWRFVRVHSKNTNATNPSIVSLGLYTSTQ